VVAGPAPFPDVTRVQALPAQQGALIAITDASVVLGDDPQLVVGSEGSPPRLVGKLQSVITHCFIMGALHQKSWHGHRCLPDPVSPLRDGELQQVSQVMLTERATRRDTAHAGKAFHPNLKEFFGATPPQAKRPARP